MRRALFLPCLGTLVLALAVSYPLVLLRQETLVPHAPGILFSGPWGYGEPPRQSVLDPWGTVWEEMSLARVVRAQVREGVPPLWNPWTACGTPLAAGMHAEAFSPLRWPLFLNPEPWAWDVYFLVRLLLAGALTAALALHLGAGTAGAAGAGAVFMLGGYATLYLNLFHLDVDVFLPGLLLCLMCSLETGGRWWLAGTAVITAQMLLGGNPQAAAVDFGFALLWAAVVIWRRRGGLRAAGRPAAAFAAGAALALPLLLPFAEFFVNAFHVHGAHAGAWWGGTVMPWRGWPAFIMPVSFGPVLAPVGFFVQGILPYAGVGALFLAFQGAGWGGPVTRRLGLLMAAAAALALAKIFGVPPLRALGELPGLNLVVWTKYAAPLFLSVALLAGLGLARLERRAASPTRTVAFLIIFAVAALFSYLVTNISIVSLMGWVFAAAVAAGWWALASLGGRTVHGRGAAWLGVVLLVIELAAWMPRPRARPHDPFRTAPYVDFLRGVLPGPDAGRVFGLGFNLAPNANAAVGLSDPRSLIDPLVFRPYWAFMDSEVAEQRRPAFLGFLKTDTLDRRALEALSFMGVRYVFSTRAADKFLAPGTKWPLRPVHRGDMNVYENARAWPRAFVLRRDGGGPVNAAITAYGPMEVDISVPGGEGRLVLTDTAYPGWRAYADGRRVPVVSHAGVFRAVDSPGRPFVLRFVYAPLQFALGLWLAGVLGAGGILAVMLPRPRPGARRKVL